MARFAVLLHVAFVLLLGRMPAVEMERKPVQDKNPVVVHLKNFEMDKQTPRRQKKTEVREGQIPKPPERKVATPVEKQQMKVPRTLLSDTRAERKIFVPVDPLPVPTPEPREAVDVGPSLISPKFKSLLPNSNLAYSNLQQSVGQHGDGSAEDMNSDGSAAVDINTREYKYVSYFDALIKQIENVWEYPQEGLRSRMQGQAFYNIVVNRDGTLRKVVGITSTGYPALDREIERAVQMAGPFNPIPARIENDPLVIRIRFTYSLTRFGIF